MIMIKTLFLFLLTIHMTDLSGLWGQPESSLSTRPNIILILSDDSGFSDLGCYGGEIRTPHLNQLAEEGLRFSQMFSCSRCWPSRAALMTGYYPQQVGMDPIRGSFPGWVRPVPQRLADAGYLPFHVGKWHIDNATPLESGFIDPETIPSAPPEAIPPTSGDLDFGFPYSESYTQQALSFLHHYRQKGSQQPFFLYLAYQAPHFPLRALERDVADYEQVYAQGWDAIREQRTKRARALGLVNVEKPAPLEKPLYRYNINRTRPFLGPHEIYDCPPWNSLSSEQQKFQARKMALHAAMMERMDSEIGRIIAYLKKNKLFENTLIIYLSDNGASGEILVRGEDVRPDARPGAADSFISIGPAWAQASNAPFRFYKMYAHEGGIASPGIFHWPARIQNRNQIRSEAVHFIDVAATILDLAGLPPAGEQMPPTLARSLVPLLTNRGSLPSAPLFFRHRGRALRLGEFKAVSAAREGDWQLHDLSTDRTEQFDLSQTYPQLLQSMIAQWEALDAQFAADAKKP